MLKLVKVPPSSRLSSLSPCRRATAPLPALPQFCPLGVEAEGRGPPACSHRASRPYQRDARLATTLSAVTASTSSSSSLEDDALCWPASFRLPRAGSACAGKGRRESVVCCSSCRHTTSRAQQGGPTTRGTWTRDGKRRQAGPLWGLPRLSTCPPGASEVVSHRPGHHMCPHLVTRELSSS